MENIQVSSELYKNFRQEFKQLLAYRCNHLGNASEFSLDMIKKGLQYYLCQRYPKVLFKNEPSVMLKNIVEPYFINLNGKLVTLLPADKVSNLKIPIYDSNNKPMKDVKGNTMYRGVRPIKDTNFVLSDTCINLRNYELKDGKKVFVKPAKGFEYLTYTKVNNAVHYVYRLPNEHLYKVTYNAYILSNQPKRSGTFYDGVQFKLQNGTDLYIYCVPTYNLRMVDSRTVLCYTRNTQIVSNILSILIEFLVTQPVYVLGNAVLTLAFCTNDTAIYNVDTGISENWGFTSLRNKAGLDSAEYNFVAETSMAEKG